MATFSITQLSAGNSGKIVQFTDEKMAGKLLSMGALPGSLVQIIRIAPFRGGYYLKIDGNNLAIRFQEAAHILLEL